MLQNTFCHIHGIGLKTEQNLWQAGILDWSDWREPEGIPLSKRSRMEIPLVFEKSMEALENNDPRFFCDRLVSAEQWRIFSQYRKDTAYLDIETTGLADDAEITTIALYDGDDVTCYINGRNLDRFPEDIDRFKVLVSYNGKGFDVPFIENYFSMKLDHAHIDLRFVLARLGFKGGLKGCEKMLGMDRGVLDGVDGSFAVYLWHHYQTYNDEKALATLLAYNIEDTVNLERLMVEAWNRNLAATPFARQLSLDYPTPPSLPYHADLQCVDRIKRNYFSR